MKNINLVSNPGSRLLKSVILMAILSSTISLASTANAKDAILENHVSSKHSRSLGQQISRLIKMENANLAGLNNGIVVISFSVNEKSQLTQVVSHSNIPAVDLYLRSSLEGKKVEVPIEHTGQGQQFIKLRFSIDK